MAGDKKDSNTPKTPNDIAQLLIEKGFSPEAIKEGISDELRRHVHDRIQAKADHGAKGQANVTEQSELKRFDKQNNFLQDRYLHADENGNQYGVKAVWDTYAKENGEQYDGRNPDPVKDSKEVRGVKQLLQGANAQAIAQVSDLLKSHNEEGIANSKTATGNRVAMTEASPEPKGFHR